MQDVGDVPEIQLIQLIHPYPVAEFVDTVLAEHTTRGHAARFDQSGFLVQVDGEQRVLLDRVYFELQDMPDEARAQHIRARLDAGLRPLPAHWSDVAPMLRSVLRPASYTSAVTADDNRPWIRRRWPFVDELAVVDTGDARAIVTQRDTANWGVTGEQMLATAGNNIAARYPPQPQQQRVGHLRGDGNSYCDSALLVPGWLSSFDTEAGHRPVVFFPGDEMLLVCTDDPGLAPEFFAAAERLYHEAVVPISPQGYTIVGSTIVPLDAAGPTPLRPLAVRARSVLAAREYRAQTERLQRYFAEQMVDTQADSVQLIETPRGSCTITLWGEGAAWLLPESDYVTFVSGDHSDHFTVPFPVVADVVGLVKHPDLVPARYAVDGWPSDDIIAVLRAHSVALPGI
jgi:hypothetical protein